MRSLLHLTRLARRLGALTALAAAAGGCTTLLGIAGDYEVGAGGAGTSTTGAGGAGTSTTGSGAGGASSGSGGATTGNGGAGGATTGAGGAGGASTGNGGAGGATTGAGGAGGASTGNGGAGGATTGVGGAGGATTGTGGAGGASTTSDAGPIDAGDSCVPACSAPAEPPCETIACVSHVCESHFKAAGTSCGGSLKCDGKGHCACAGDGDCQLGDVCVKGTCKPPTCSDGLADGAETDVDCGGGGCPTCGEAKACKVGGDCTSGVCTSLHCAPSPCAPGETNCSGACVDLLGSKNDCGACGRSCLNGTCSSGKCSAFLVDAPQDTSFVRIAAAGSTVIAADFNGKNVFAWPAPGFTRQVLFSGDNYLAVATDGTTAFAGSPASVYRVPLAGGQPTTVASGQNGVGQLAIGATALYWPTANNTTIWSAPLAGGPPVPVLGPDPAYANVSRVAVTTKSIYWDAWGAGGSTLYVAPLAPGAPKAAFTAATPLSDLTYVAATNRVVFAATYWNGAKGGVYQTVDGSADAQAIVSPLATLSNVVGDAKGVYVAVYDPGAGSSQIRRVTWGGASTTLADVPSAPVTYMALAGSTLYWVEDAPGPDILRAMVVPP